MKSKQYFYTVLLLLATLLLARGVEDVDASSPVQTMSTGETPTAFVRNKIDSHDVSRRQSRM
jgi:hypothetical protein